MNRTIASARAAALTGIAATVALLAAWIVLSRVDRLGIASLLLRWLHILAGMVWVGMIVFVNFIQLAAVQAADDAGRGTLLKHVVPAVAGLFRRASHAVMLTGFLLLFTTGYLLDRWVFLSAVYIPTPRNLLLWGGALGGLVMWLLVHLVIWPGLRTILGLDPGDEALKAAARARVAICARLNLVLAIPVTFAMIAAAHLY